VSPTGDGLTDVSWCQAQYDAEVRTADEGVAELLSGLARLGVADNTILVVIGDHGESLGEHGIYFDHYGLYDCVLRPPLIIRWPGSLSGEHRIDDLVQMSDLAPTILEMTGLPVSPGMDGRSLVPVLREAGPGPEWDRVVACECNWSFNWAMRKDNWKIIVSRAPDLLHNRPPIELYDLAEDPGETRNLALRDPRLAGEWLGDFEGWLGQRLGRAAQGPDPVRAEAEEGHSVLRWRFAKARARWALRLWLHDWGLA
jgi:arylsulfatase A-like enzyme